MSTSDDPTATPQHPEAARQPHAQQAQPPEPGFGPPAPGYPAAPGYPPAGYPHQEPYPPAAAGYPAPGPAYAPPPPQYQAPYGAADAERKLARKRVEARRALGAHAASYVVVNAFLIVVWAFSGAGYFWPIWVLAGWGVGLVLNAWDVLLRRPVTEDDIERELRRGRNRR